ncbi:hypothetical protein [Bifidobacterium lemurum]|nr:hypothetical protein [Bifidobacterium lemurum]QOL33887.1 hypothetical protein BL8807_08975 [Bifidobacterium lemurum]
MSPTSRVPSNPEAAYWRTQADLYARRAERLLIVAMVSCCLCLGWVLFEPFMAVSWLPLPVAGLLAGAGAWCRRNASDALDLADWSMEVK